MASNYGKNQITVCFVFVAMTLTWSAQAEIYRTTDKQGIPVFTDQPSSQQQAEKVEIQPTNITPPPEDIPALKKEVAPTDNSKSTETSSPTDTSLPGDSETENDESNVRQNNQENLIKETAKTHYDQTGSDKEPGQQQKKVDYKLKHVPEAQRKHIEKLAKKGAPKTE